MIYVEPIINIVGVKSENRNVQVWDEPSTQTFCYPRAFHKYRRVGDKNNNDQVPNMRLNLFIIPSKVPFPQQTHESTKMRQGSKSWYGRG